MSSIVRAAQPNEAHEGAVISRNLRGSVQFTARAISMDEWHGFAQQQPDRMIFHHRCWLELMMEQYGLKCHITGVEVDNEIVAAAPFLRTRSLSGKVKYVCLPFTDYVHPLVSREDARSALLSAVLNDPVLRKSRGVLIRTDKPLGKLLAANPWVRHHLDITGSMEEVSRRFDRKVLQNLRRGERSGLQFKASTDRDSLEAFYRLHTATRRKLGVPVQPHSFFLRLHERVIAQGCGFVGLSYLNGAPVAGGVFLGDNRSLFAKYLASDPAALQVFPNEHLLYHAIQVAVEQGHSVFDFGLTKKEQEGLRRFKQKWGAVESDVFQENVIGGVEKFGQDSKLLELAKSIIKRSPTVVCRALGEMFYRYSY